ncbi:hypothetical protein [Phenylobacterium deserti]|uniref:Uncharacterized protein n=1 Tax=Phenylobacterium deserti TaxID=1914756 RepID=A0A328ABX7_9CAUL|nr:hypothetical protein [Phenylobacterium deserti]RAK52119.1 hypothetical protein DJ018_13265 [Phenylobacterium deserti]
MALRDFHGLIQKAFLDASSIPWRTYERDCFWIVEKWVRQPHKRGEWLHVCKCESQDEAEDFLVGKLTQED